MRNGKTNLETVHTCASFLHSIWDMYMYFDIVSVANTMLC